MNDELIDQLVDGSNEPPSSPLVRNVTETLDHFVIANATESVGSVIVDKYDDGGCRDDDDDDDDAYDTFQERNNDDTLHETGSNEDSPPRKKVKDDDNNSNDNESNYDDDDKHVENNDDDNDAKDNDKDFASKVKDSIYKECQPHQPKGDLLMYGNPSSK